MLSTVSSISPAVFFPTSYYQRTDVGVFNNTILTVLEEVEVTVMNLGPEGIVEPEWVYRNDRMWGDS